MTMMSHARGALPFLLTSLLVGAVEGGSCPDQAVDDHSSDRAMLLEGVTTIARPGVPGPLVLSSDDAFALVAGRSGGGLVSVVAAACPGKGRVVAFGHGGYLNPGGLGIGETGRLMNNAVIWATRGKKAPRIGTWHCAALASWLRGKELAVEGLDEQGLADSLKRVDLLCATAHDLGGPESIRAVRQFVRRGGGLLIADLGWGWQQLHPHLDLRTDHPGNQLLAPLGIAWAGGTIERIEAVSVPPDRESLEMCHAGHLLTRLEEQARGERKLSAEEGVQAATIVTMAARWLAPDDALLLPRVRRLVSAAGDETYPRPDHPVGRDDPIARLAIVLRHLDEERLAPGAVGAAPFHELFPGPVPDEAPRVEQALRIDMSIDGWAGTGLYAPPGEWLSVRCGTAVDSGGIFVRIGCHSDRLWGSSEWRRDPEICRRTPLQPGLTRIVNPHGGPVYIEVPAGRTGWLDMTVQGAIRAPRFVLGETPLDRWRETIRREPAPWAELESGKIKLSVPSSSVRELDDPVSLMEFWDGVLDCYAELGGRPLPRRAERMVTDVQISAGYMHSGYPIMMHLDVADVITKVEVMRGKKHGGVWGLWHELGHNHQRPEWTFAGTGEVTCNLFTLYVIEKLSGVKPMAGPEMQGQIPRIREYLAAGAPFERWKASPFLALAMYAQVQDAFGWGPFKKVFAEYRDLPPAESPRSDQEKRDQWLVRLSHATGRNLGSFFAAWGVPVSRAACEEVGDLEPWLPALLRGEAKE